MNPFAWKREQKVALAIGALIGAVVGPIVGYYAYALGQGAEGAVDLVYWLVGSKRYTGWIWLFPGSLVGAGVIYASKLLRQ